MSKGARAQGALVTAPLWELRQGTRGQHGEVEAEGQWAALGVGAGAGEGTQSRAPAVGIWGPRSVWINGVCAFLVENSVAFLGSHGALDHLIQELNHWCG